MTKPWYLCFWTEIQIEKSIFLFIIIIIIGGWGPSNLSWGYNTPSPPGIEGIPTNMRDDLTSDI